MSRAGIANCNPAGCSNTPLTGSTLPVFVWTSANGVNVMSIGATIAPSGISSVHVVPSAVETLALSAASGFA